jgi:hypothetical protein
MHANNPLLAGERDAYNPHPLPERIPGPPSSSEGVTAQECGLRCGFGGFGWVGLGWDHPRGLRGLE